MIMSARTQAFSGEIQKMVDEGLTYLEAIAVYCEDNDIEPWTIKKYIDDILKEKIRVCCAKNKLICDELPPTLVDD